MAVENNGKNIPDRVVRIELISHFNLYPETVASSDEMARRLSRESVQVEKQMEDLVELHILRRTYVGDRTLYSYLAPMSMSQMAKRSLNKASENMFSGISGPGRVKRDAGTEREGEDIEPESGTALRMRLMIAALKRESWKECLELLMNTIYRSLETPCAAYHLGERCSEMRWDYQRGTNGVRAGMTKVKNVQNMVIEGELIREKGFLETAYHLKYLYPLSDYDDVLVCISRKGSMKMDLRLIKSLLVDIMPVVSEKFRLDFAEEMNAERALQDSIYWSTLHLADMREGLVGALASVAKSVDADRVSLLLEDGSGTLRTLSTYGLHEREGASKHSFPIGEGVAGWCAKKGDSAIITEPRIDPRYIRNEYDDIDSMLCCPLIPPEGAAIGAICAVNKHVDGSGDGTCFDRRDVRLVEGIARTLTTAFLAKDNGTRTLPRRMIDQALATHAI